ncbi:gelsolin repeat domain-containing protein [Ditylenchus destructor]|uniref:Gelsolin repeat domain-containing protein n=1 Tax=Ditylenchus destructor TaxID=166010 RepID=A0AAD4NLZ3_9BILA|nr:gelsolin repeat domain-containing protein [Ditylenchus destructor]
MSTGVLPFIRGIDFSRNDFSGDRFPNEVVEMTQATWLKLNRAQLERVPDVLSNLKNLEHLQMSRNKLQNVHGELSDLPLLRSVIVRQNEIKTSGIPTDIFRMKDLTIIDFSHNSLRDVPSNLEYAKCAIVLNLSHNKIENLPTQIFSNLIDLIFLDISDNKIEAIPPQLRRLTNLQVLKMSNNPLTHYQFKQLPGSKFLRVLHLRNTHRTQSNIPPTFEEVPNLKELDLAMNDLPSVPESLHVLKNLRKLDLSHNKLTKMEIPEGAFENLESLNISGNELTALPEGIVRCLKMQRLYASYNKLTFEGLPGGIGKLVQLQVLFLSHNNLELIPQGVGRCVKLQRLRLDHNRLITLPDGIHLLPDLKELDLHNNDDIVMPPKPSDKQKAMAFYNIDFSLSNQLRLAGQSPASSISSLPSSSITQKDPVQRKKEFIKRRRCQADQDGASKVIQGMSKMARVAQESADVEEMERASRPAISWKDKMEQQKPRLDYSDVFDADVGESEGLWVWEIENFYPQPVEPQYFGQFYEADSYLVLKTTKEPSGSLTHAIYYWIGEKTTLDKGMCAAVHAVNLRNHLGASCRTVREEMNDESDEFLELFSEEIVYFSGARTQSGFYTVEKTPFAKRLYRASVNGPAIEMEAVPITPESLDPRFVFLLDVGEIIWIWSGAKSRVTVANKVRLFAVKMNKRDRKGKAEIESCNQWKTPEEFWIALTGSPKKPEEPIVEHVPENYVSERKRLYLVQMGMGFLELPQIELKHGILNKDMLQTKNVYILDATSDIFLWIGKSASRMVKMAGQKMVVELHRMLERPDYTTVSRENEGEESTVFRSKFAGWDDIVPFDFTMTADTVQRRGADIKVIMERDKMKTDLVALFLDRLPAMTHEDADQMIEECNEDLEIIEPFVLEGKKFVRLPSNEFGTFYTMDCYVFLCRYYVMSEEDSDISDEDRSSEEKEDETKKKESETKADDEKADDFKCVVYFWQGRDANNMGWLQFTFSLQKKFESLFKDKLEVVRMYQQQENQKFLSHFKKKFVIRRGRRNLSMNLGGKWPELFHMRANGSAVCTRTIQIDCRAQCLNSGFCYILRYPFPTKDEHGNAGIVYVWLGSKSDVYYHPLSEQVARELINKGEEFPMETIREGCETELFWTALGGKKKYDVDADFMNWTRLFRCTNDKGFFSVSEKTVDFCQDDLDDEDVMIVDTGEFIFLWLGSKSSEVEVKLAYKAAQVYQGHMQMKQTDRPRKLMLSIKGRESKRFTRVFHGWGKHKVPAGD